MIDHYFPWIRNCVGYFNKKFFLLLLIYGAASTITMAVALAPYLLDACTRMSGALDFLLVFAWVLALMLGVALCCFLAFHVCPSPRIVSHSDNYMF